MEALLADIKSHEPTLVVISGDLTQRARRSQFKAARAFLDRIPFPQLVVPGNHDIPFYDFTRRFIRPLHRYKRFISPNLDPTFLNDRLAVFGVNTARSATFKDGRISREQIAELQGRICGLSPVGRFRVLVTHHPFLPPPGSADASVVGRGREALSALEKCGVELILAGHLHLPYTGDVRTHYVNLQQSVLVAQAGTACSYRRRGEPNAYNYVSMDSEGVTIEVRTSAGGAFDTFTTTRHVRGEAGWQTVR